MNENFTRTYRETVLVIFTRLESHNGKVLKFSNGLQYRAISDYDDFAGVERFDLIEIEYKTRNGKTGVISLVRNITLDQKLEEVKDLLQKQEL